MIRKNRNTRNCRDRMKRNRNSSNPHMQTITIIVIKRGPKLRNTPSDIIDYEEVGEGTVGKRKC
jgi:hypothetical protein